MKTSLKMRLASALASLLSVTFAPSVGADDFDPIVDPSRPLGLNAYDVCDYVQDGLVAHFDGIRNAGAAKPHDDEATEWVDLVDETRKAAFVDVKVDVEARAGVRDGTKRWLSDGYYFDGTVYAQMQTGVALGLNATVEMASDFTPSSQMTNHYPNVFAAPNDFCFFFGNNGPWKTDVLTWKQAPYACPANTYNRPQLNPWGGKYMTATMDDESICLFEGTQCPTDGSYSKARTATVEIPETQWTWGGSASGSSDRTAIGVVKSLRLYNRVLTEAELVHNRMVDDIRFNAADGGGSADGAAVVQSTVPGAEANEPCGGYLVNGVYTFSAPERTSVGDVEYAPVGFQVEYWNAASNVWGFASESTDTTFTYTNCAARPRVRLTWIWKPVKGVVRWDASAYAQHGMVFNFDGVENAGAGLPHASDMAGWTNLVAGGVSATRLQMAFGDAGHWTSHGYRFNGRDYFQLDKALDFGDKATLQFSFDFQCGEQTFPTVEGGWPTFFGCTGDVFNLYTQNQWENLTFKMDAVVGGGWEARCPTLSPISEMRFVNAFLDFDATALRSDAEPPAWTATGLYKQPIGPRFFCIGGVPLGDTDAARARRSLRGTIFTMRGYTRTLSSWELARNRDVDNVRFWGERPSLTASNGVFVVSNVAGLSGNEPCAFYEVLGGAAATFSAPSGDVEQDGRTYRAAGYALERWNDETQMWEGQETEAANAWTFPSSETAAFYRLTWQWTVVKGLRVAGDYDVDDYVQSGLVAHYDGIRNVAASLPHDMATTNWCDLSGRNNTCARSLLGGNSVAAGAWADDGYAFEGASNFRMRNSLSLGLSFTIQAVCDVDAGAQTNQFPNYVTGQGDYGIFSGGTGRKLVWKDDAWTGHDYTHRSWNDDWAGRYFTAVMTADSSWLFEGTVYSNGVARTLQKPFSSARWSIGAAADGSMANRCMVGRMQAVRFYDRALTEAEIARNRKVDDARYKGMAVTNVVVASSRADCAGVEPNGAYEVEGRWTFTAMPVEIDGEEYVPTGYALETWTDGAWSTPVVRSGTNYEHVVSDTAPAVRLTWQFHSMNGTLIVFR